VVRNAFVAKSAKLRTDRGAQQATCPCYRSGVSGVDPAALDAITRQARGTRHKTSRAVWLVAAVVGVICGIAFVVVVLSEGNPRKPTGTPPPASTGWGFSAGLLIGAVVGIAVGLAIARQRAHSSRSKP